MRSITNVPRRGPRLLFKGGTSLSKAYGVHIFAACPNSVLFYLGQQHQGIAPCIVYEFDFDRRAHKTYQPSFVID